ncbi:MAG: tetratricopeptide repeat protein, partial [Bacteroidota bacterium]
INLLEKNNFQNTHSYIQVAENISFSLYKKGMLDSALIYIEKAIVMSEKLYGKQSKTYLNNRSVLAKIYFEKGKIDSSYEIDLEVFEFNKRTYGINSNYYAESLMELASYYNSASQFQRAIDSVNQALKIYEVSYGKGHIKTLNCLSSLALYNSNLGNYELSLDLNLKILKQRETLLGTSHEDYLLSLNNTAHAYMLLARYDNAKTLFENSLNTQRGLGDTINRLYMTTLSNYSILLSELGNFEESLTLSMQSLNISRNLFGTNNSDFALRLNNLGVVYKNIEKFSLAKVYFDSAIVISERLLGKYHPNTTEYRQNYASTLSDLNDYKKAIEIQEDCLKGIREISELEGLNYAHGLSQLAFYHSKINQDSTALEYNRKVLEIRKKILGENHPKTLLTKFNLSVDYSRLGEHLKSISLLEYVLKNRVEKFGADHFETKLVYNNIGLEYFKLGQYDKALEYLKKCTGNSVYYPGQDAALLNISSTYEMKNELSQAIYYQIKAVNWYVDDYLKNEISLSENEKAQYKQKLDYYINYLITLNSRNGFNDRDYLWYNNYITAKNLINIQEGLDQSFLNSSSVQKVQQLSNELNLLKNKKNKLLELDDQVRLDSVLAEIERLEIRISSLLGENKKPLRFQMIQESLSEAEDVFVDIVGYSTIGDAVDNYVIVLTKSSEITVIPINSDFNVGNDLFKFYLNDVSSKEHLSDLKDSIFYNTFWKPISDKIGTAKVVYVSLGGDYNNINLNTLYNPETGKYLIEEKDIRIVNSARDFVLMNGREKKQYTSTNSALYGFPDYNGNTTSSADTTDYLAATRDLNQNWIESLTRGGMKASALPATKMEVEQIAGTFQKNGWKVSTYTGAEASETNIKKEESPRVLHVATHGYFFEDIPMDKSEDRFLGMDRQRVVQDPMLRSGLLFTGANKTLQGEEPKGENGLLSAAEASLLDLRETELVVLSACETGRGEIKNGEGVYGLRKAFADAGAQNIIMSLWKVDDKVTQEFMTRFYEVWLNEKTTIREAFNR